MLEVSDEVQYTQVLSRKESRGEQFTLRDLGMLAYHGLTIYTYIYISLGLGGKTEISCTSVRARAKQRKNISKYARYTCRDDAIG